MEKPIESLIHKGCIERLAEKKTLGIINLFEDVTSNTATGIEVYLDYTHSFFLKNQHLAGVTKDDQKLNMVVYFFLIPTTYLYPPLNGFHPKEFIAVNVAKQRFKINDHGLSKHRPCTSKLTVDPCTLSPQQLSLYLPNSSNMINKFHKKMEIHFGLNDLGEYSSFYIFDDFDFGKNDPPRPFTKIVMKQDTLEYLSCPHNRNVLIPAMEFERIDDRASWSA